MLRLLHESNTKQHLGLNIIRRCIDIKKDLLHMDYEQTRMDILLQRFEKPRPCQEFACGKGRNAALILRKQNKKQKKHSTHTQAPLYYFR